MTDKLKDFAISFIIPVLNGEKHIGQCLDHILREMNDNDEIIVVDNGSTDDTLKIVKQFNKARYLVFPKVTIATLRNRGADIAKGDVLAFIDSDCLVCEGWREAVELVLSDNRIKVTGSICDIPLSATWIEKAWWSLRSPIRTKVNYIASANFVIRHEIFSEVSGFNEKLITDEDSEICSRINRLDYCIIDDPEIRTIHLENAKTLKDFVKKEKWHATSILSTMSTQMIDKPIIMTFIFMVCLLVSLALVPFYLFYNFSPIFIVFPIFFAPLATTLYRVYQYKNLQYFFHLIILYFVFYFARSVTVIEILFNAYKKKHRQDCY